MMMPNAENALVEEQKIVGYLLNRAHPDNGGKAEFFIGVGFTAGDWELMAEAFREMALNTEASKCVQSPYGTKYVLEGELSTPCGKRPFVRSVWIIDIDASEPRLVTAYART